ncbi:MAG: phage tail assembly protein, partial [Tepidiformaceae bacterium]
QNQAYLIIILLANVITHLGELTYVSTFEVEKFFTSDLAFLQRLYRQINERGTSIITVQCPECSTEVEVDIASLGGSLATPSNESMRR